MQTNNYLFTTLLGGLLSLAVTANAQSVATVSQTTSVKTAFYQTADTNGAINSNGMLAQDDQDQSNDATTNSDQSDSSSDDSMDNSDTTSNDDTNSSDNSSSPTYDSQNNDVPDSTGTDNQ
jgi:hypothetical protein